MSVAAGLSGIELPRVAGDTVIGFVLALSRVGPLFLLAPIFSSSMIPRRAKAIVAMAISIPMTSIATQGQELPTDAIALAGTILKEILIGIAFAFSLQVIASAIQLGGSILDTIVGFSFGAVLDPINNAHNAVIGQVYALVATMVFLLTGGDQVMILGLAKTYEVAPLTGTPGFDTLAALALHGFVDILVIGLELVAPVLICLVVTDVAFGIVSRAAPQMNVFTLGLPAKVLVAFGVMAVSLPIVATSVRSELEGAVYDALRFLGAS